MKKMLSFLMLLLTMASAVEVTFASGSSKDTCDPSNYMYLGGGVWVCVPDPDLDDISVISSPPYGYEIDLLLENPDGSTEGLNQTTTYNRNKNGVLPN